jgi:transcriptional regulator with XRE-family HTH domain
MVATSSQAEVGALLREWRERRRMTQLDLALEAGVSTRHLSFVETGRSKPGRETLLRIVEHLDVPFREQNRLLLATGHAPAFPERSLDDPDLAPVHEALDLVLARHDPYPAVVVDRHWNLVAANSALLALTEGADVDPGLLKPPINVLRLGLHPRGLAPLMVNLSEWRAHFRDRLEQQVEAIGDENLRALLKEISSYPDPENEREPEFARAESGVLGPLKVRAPDGSELSFLGMFATFDTPFEVTSSELAIELLFPADRATGKTLQALARNRRENDEARTAVSASPNERP